MWTETPRAPALGAALRTSMDTSNMMQTCQAHRFLHATGRVTCVLLCVWLCHFGPREIQERYSAWTLSWLQSDGG